MTPKLLLTVDGLGVWDDVCVQPRRREKVWDDVCVQPRRRECGMMYVYNLEGGSVG